MNTADRKKLVDYWKKTAEHDHETMRTLFEGKRYDATLFFGHIILEKMLKALIAHKIGEQAPYTHDLVRLGKISLTDLSKDDLTLLETVSTFNIEARYPKERLEFYKRCTYSYAEKYRKDIESLYERLCQQLKQKKVVKKYIEQLGKAKYPFTAVYLFGSFAKGTSHKDSDIDVAVVTKAVERNYMKNWLKLWELRRDVDLRIEPHGFSPKDFKEDWRPMVHEIKTTGIRIK